MTRRTLLVGLLALVPAAAVAAPVPKGAKKAAPSVAGTVWAGDGLVPRSSYEFRADGTILLESGGTGPRRPAGTWTQDGATVSWQFNNRYAEYRGTVRGDRMAVEAWNVTGSRWAGELSRPPAAQPAPPAGR